MIKNVFFDFNGTLINDVNLCIDLLNKFLENQNKKLVTKERYKEIFRFPIQEYYRLAGIDFNIESYESLSIKFIEEYQPKSYLCGLYDGVYETLEFLKNKNINLYVLSASEINNLKKQCDMYKISGFFKEIIGLDNIHAASKIDVAKEYIKNHNINPSETIFIGDTLHDVEVADAIGVNCFLVSCGHQSVNVLKQAKKTIIDDINVLRLYYDEIFNR